MAAAFAVSSLLQIPIWMEHPPNGHPYASHRRRLIVPFSYTDNLAASTLVDVYNPCAKNVIRLLICKARDAAYNDDPLAHPNEWEPNHYVSLFFHKKK